MRKYFNSFCFSYSEKSTRGTQRDIINSDNAESPNTKSGYKENYTEDKSYKGNNNKYIHIFIAD